MRLALLVEYYPPSRASAAVQMSDLAAAFEREGHEITLFTTNAEQAEPTFTRENGVDVLRVPTRKVKGIGLARRALNEIFISLQLRRGARRCGVDVRRFDAIVWYSPTIFLAPFVAWLKHRSGAPGYLILRDIFPQWALDAGVMRRGPAYYFFRACELFQYSVADVIGVQSPANLEYFEHEARRRPRRLEVLYNWIDLARPEPAPVDVIERHGLAGKRILVYGGNMGVAQDVDNLLRLAESLRGCEDIALLLVGSGSEVPRLKALIAERRLANVVLTDEVDGETFRAILRRSHAGLITLDRRLTTHNIPGKLLAYLEAGLPVIASVNPGNDLLAIIEASGAGLGFVNGEDRAFADAAASLVRDPARCAGMAGRAKLLAHERFSVEAVVRQLTSALERRTPVAAPNAA
jgi:glycosyltransferase involved in cell wall biosynthesis